MKQGMCICLSKSAHKVVHKTERESLKKLGKSIKPSGLKGKALKQAIQAKKDAGDWGTATLGKVIKEAKKSIASAPKDKNGKPTTACLEKANAAVDKQTENMRANQTARTSGTLPNEAAVTKMLT